MLILILHIIEHENYISLSNDSEEVFLERRGFKTLYMLLILIFVTHSLQARANQAWPHYGPDLYTKLYFILLSMAEAHVIYERNGGSVGWRVWIGSFWTYCMSLAHAYYQVGKGYW